MPKRLQTFHAKAIEKAAKTQVWSLTYSVLNFLWFEMPVWIRLWKLLGKGCNRGCSEKKIRRSLPYTMKSSVSSAEIPVGQYVVSQRQYLESLIASPSLEFVDKKMQKHCIKGWLYRNSGCFVLTHDYIIARRKMTQHIPGSSKCVPHQKNLPKGTNFTQLEDPGIYNW